MYTPTVLFTLLVLGFAAAQNSTSTFDASQVDQTQKSECLLRTSSTLTPLITIRQINGALPRRTPAETSAEV